MQTLGSTSAMNGAPRIVWGLTRVFNAISQHVYREDLIDDEAASALANGFLDVLKPQALVDAGRLALLVGYWQNLLRAKLAVRPVKVELVTVNVFGFSRGAAEARTFVHWLYQLCSKDDGGYTFAGIPLRVQFLGIFDTVASVGLAGLYTFIEGRAGWAKGLSEWTACSAARAMVGPAVAGFREREALMAGKFFADDLQKALDKARNAPQYLAQWREFLNRRGMGDVRDVAVERDGIRLLEAVRAAPVPPAVEALLEDLVHDSMAGFIGFGMPEFETNGYGLAKFRRIFFGNRGDEMLREQVERHNKQQVSAFERKAAKERAQQAQWEAESREFQRTQVRSR